MVLMVLAKSSLVYKREWKISGGGLRSLDFNIHRVNSFYFDPLDRNGIFGLYQLLVHESIHRTMGRIDMISRPFNHPDIYREEADRARFFNDVGGLDACGCDAE